MHGEGALAHRVVEATHGGGIVDLARTDDHRDRRKLESTEQLEDAMAGGVIVLVIHRDGEVDHGDVDSLMLD